MVGTIVGMLNPELKFNPQSIIPGDRVLAFRSSGPHTNGYSLINRLITDGRLDGNCWRRELTEPHINYHPFIQRIWNSPTKIDVKALCHITGGGLVDNPPRILPDNCYIHWTEWEIPPVFKAIQEAGRLTDTELVRTFNCGLGMLIVLPDNQHAIDLLVSLFPDNPLIEVGTVQEKA
jgi:phosphoribosylformylglycinamidine cyclo-ligase